MASSICSAPADPGGACRFSPGLMRRKKLTDTVDGQPYEDFVHTGPGTLAGRYLRMFWQPVFRGQDLGPGQAAPVQVMSERFTLYRGESGTPHLTAFRCAHRGTQRSTGWVEDDCIRCL